ncbi:phospholipase/carboxylesterase [Rhypophila decipiens]|uniref:Phospholipase/carboxylesterase n=1 Tax=Rhypophila decipiens TaxID=261697 RepID=A0AAN6Y136_9PEZI|nr:phospholipase/carboxylesterase [Rhypophila decipiens]
MASATPYVVNPIEGNPHTHTIIFLHGRDSVAKEFADELFESEASPSTESTSTGLTLPDLLPTIKWVFPSAPLLHSARFNKEMSQWFDMWSAQSPSERPELQIPGLKQSIKYIQSVVDCEATLLKKGGGRERVFLAGISQGFAAAIASYFAEGRGDLAGVIGLSSWMPFVEQAEGCLDNLPIMKDGRGMNDVMVTRKLSQIYRFGDEEVGEEIPGVEEGSARIAFRTSLFLEHCADDKVVPKENGERMKKALTAIVDRCCGRVEWHLYEGGGQWLNEPQGVDDLVKFIRENMAKGG